VLDLLYIFYC